MEVELLDPSECVLDNLSRNDVAKVSMHQNTKEFLHVQALLKKLVLEGTSSSLIILGPPGCGKTTFLESAVASLESDEIPEARLPLIATLSGLICIDLHTSMVCISKILEMENEFADLLGTGINFEDRLSDVLDFLRNSLKFRSKRSNLVICLDKIDLFCEHRGQALLYNLFDIVHANESSLCVIGLTSRVDVLEMLEKRVKSRFSHRIIHLHSLSFADYFEFAKNLLILQKAVDEEAQSWNSGIESLFGEAKIKEVFHNLYDYRNTVSSLVNLLYGVLLSSDGGNLTSEVFSEVFSENCQSSVLQQALDLSISEMFVMLGVYRHLKNGMSEFNFSTLYKIVGKSASESCCINKSHLSAGFEFLKECELITPVGKNSDSNQSYCRSEITFQEFGRIFKAYPNLPTVFQNFL